MWAIHSSEQQLNQSIQHHDTKQLHKIAKNKQTYQFLTTIKKAEFENATDNQGRGPIGYYRVDINQNPSDLQSILNITSFQKNNYSINKVISINI